MATAALPQPRLVSFPQRLFEPLPGIALLAAIGLLGKFIEQRIAIYGRTHHLHLPNIEYVLWAILIGVVVANTVGVPKVFHAGIATYDFWLKTGIVLLGARFLVGDLALMGSLSLLLVVIELALAISFMTWLGGKFGLKPKLTSLLAVGSAVCGVSAIIATQGAIEADDEDSSFAIAAILALGALSLFTFPLIGHTLHLTDHAYGVWSGLAVDNTAEAAAAGALYSDAAGKLAVLTKTTRNALIGFVVLGYAIYWASRGQAKAVEGKAAFLWQKFPKFVLGFLFVSLLATFQVFDKTQVASLANLSRWAFLLTFAGVGLKTDFREIKRQGVRPFVVGALAELTITVVTLGLVLAASAIFTF